MKTNFFLNYEDKSGNTIYDEQIFAEDVLDALSIAKRKVAECMDADAVYFVLVEEIAGRNNKYYEL